MRPVHLHLEGFGAFRDAVDIDFDGADLFALVGPTGAGKSTVIDGICFALYGSIPRYDDERRVGDAVSLGRAEAKVGLTFDLDGRRYRVVRVVRRDAKGKATTKEARLELVRPDGDTEVLEGKVREANDRIEALLGMPFDHFTRCVVLPQGEFARFLHDKPSDRQELLADLLNVKVYARMGAEARARASALANQAAVIEAQLEKLAGATPEALAAARHRSAALDAFRDRIATARPEVEALDAAMEAARKDAADARALAERLAAVRVPDDIIEAASLLDAASSSLAGAEKVAVQADAEVARLEQEAETLPSAGELEPVLVAHRDLASRRKQAEELTTAVAGAERAESEARTALDGADRALDGATAALAAAEGEHAAHAVAEHLVAGEPCPVCLQVVGTLPDRKAPAELDRARADVEAARKSQAAARRQHADAEKRLAAAQADLASCTTTVKELEERVAAHLDVAAVEALVTKVKHAAASLKEARTAAAAAQKAAKAAAAHVKEIEQRVGAAAGEYEAQRDPVVALGPPGRTDAGLAADWQSLAEWAAAQAPVQVARAEKSEGEHARLKNERDEALTALGAAAGELGVVILKGEGRPIDRLAEGVAEAVAQARQAVSTIEEQITEAGRLAAEVSDVRHRVEVAKLLGQLLASHGFERWLVEEALEVLVQDASVTLRRLSDDAYSLAINDRNEFLVIDHGNADERRPAKTLSGGETFQASLALALALADQLAGLAAEGGAKLEAIFLDEGFGTLDDETLDVVAATIETLGAGERTVGLITHVKELAARVPVRYEVQKGAKGSTVTKVVA